MPGEEVYPAWSVVNAHTHTPNKYVQKHVASYYLRTSSWHRPTTAKMHMHKVFSANRAALCLDGTQLSLQSPCVSVALQLFSGFRVEQTLLKHTGPHTYTNTINSGACFHLHLFPDQKHTHMEARTHTHPFSYRHECKNFLVIHQRGVLVWAFKTNGQRHFE